MFIIYFRIFGQFTNFIFLFNIRENLGMKGMKNIKILRFLGDWDELQKEIVYKSNRGLNF